MESKAIIASTLLAASLSASALAGPGDYYPWNVEPPAGATGKEPGLVPGLDTVGVSGLVGIDFPKDGVRVTAAGKSNNKWSDVKFASLEYSLPDPVNGPIDDWFDLAVVGKPTLLTVVTPWTVSEDIKEKAAYGGVRVWAANGCITVKWGKAPSPLMTHAACRAAK